MCVLVLVGGCTGLSAESETPYYLRMSDDDVARAAGTLQVALASNGDGETRAWRNDATTMRGAITPLQTYVTTRGYYCRDYREDLWVADGRQSHVNTACLNDAGDWIWVGAFGEE